MSTSTPCQTPLQIRLYFAKLPVPLRSLSVLLVLCLTLGCTTFPHRDPPARYAGHWTVGAPYSQFDTADGQHHFYIFDDDMPAAAVTFIDTQPLHHDSTSESGVARSAYFEVIGRLHPYQTNTVEGTATHQRLHVERLLQMAPARAEYLAQFK